MHLLLSKSFCRFIWREYRSQKGQLNGNTAVIGLSWLFIICIDLVFDSRYMQLNRFYKSLYTSRDCMFTPWLLYWWYILYSKSFPLLAIHLLWEGSMDFNVCFTNAPTISFLAWTKDATSILLLSRDSLSVFRALNWRRRTLVFATILSSFHLLWNPDSVSLKSRLKGQEHWKFMLHTTFQIDFIAGFMGESSKA